MPEKTRAAGNVRLTQCSQFEAGLLDVNQSECDALVVRGYLSEEEWDNGAALKKAIEAVLSDIELDRQSETAERSRARV